MREKLKHLEIKKKKVAIAISTIASLLIILSALLIILSAKHHPNTKIETIKNILNSKIQISVLQIILLLTLSVGIAYTVFFLRKHYIEIAEKIKKIKKGIKAEEDALEILKKHLKLQNIQTNTEIKDNNNNTITDIDILATSEKLNTPISIEVKGLRGTIKIENNKILFQDKPLNLKQLKTIKEYTEKILPNSTYKIMIFFPYAKIETNDKQKKEELKQKGYTEIETFQTKILISNSYYIKNILKEEKQ